LLLSLIFKFFIFQGLNRNGLRPLSDPRFKDTIDKIKALGHDPESIPEVLSMEDFKKLVGIEVATSS